MVFNSFEFLIFWPVVTILYFVLPKKLKWMMLLLASYYFYVSWNFDLVFLILFTTVISYVSALIIEKRRENKALTKACLTVTLIASLGVLFFFKYFNFLSTSVTGLLTALGAKVQPLEFDLILPVGISFYTFQTLSYAIDVYRGQVKAERHFGYYALYVSFFPQLVAGPIERPENLLPQLHADNPPAWRNIIGGLRKMIIGFFKKVVVADMLAGYVNSVYNNVDGATGLGVALATVMFAFQIYGDFAGYTDIAIGCAEIMGIKLMKNFNLPYTAQSIKEFWARWHISLSTWFRDYLYIPLGGNRCSKFRHQMNVMIVFLVSGLWHGA
ncbi:MAG: MBOAT family protein, partial [Clostridiales bacterium]|nr:MBOAT family protein [Clostridiales bacterium]